jgi:hypothetical protein
MPSCKIPLVYYLGHRNQKSKDNQNLYNKINYNIGYRFLSDLKALRTQKIVLIP